MGRISFEIERCVRCRMHLDLCVCGQIPTIDVATKIVVIMHKREFVKISATAPLALECLTNSELLIHGHRESPVDLGRFIVPERRLMLLFPRPGSRVLDRELVESDPRPITLLVPDGNWGQASRMSRRMPGVENARTVILPKGLPTAWGLRTEPHEEGLATFEAISRALGIIESPEFEKQMDAVFTLMVRRARKLRGWD